MFEISKSVAVRRLKILHVSDSGSSGVFKDVRSLVQADFLLLQAALEKRIDGLCNFLDEIVNASEMGQLESLESRSAHELASLRSEFDRVLDEFEDRLETAEEQVIAERLDVRLEELASSEFRPALGDPAEFATSDLVLRLREFLSVSQSCSPSIEMAKQKLIMAKTALQLLRSQNAVDGDSGGLQAFNEQEIKDLGPLVVELAILVSKLERSSEELNPNEPESIVKNSSRSARQRETSVNGSSATKIPSAKCVDIIPMEPEEIDRYEEDYYNHQSLVQALRGTATTDAHRAEVREREALLHARRDELSVWRNQGGYLGETPRLFADTFKGALPGQSHVRGATKDATKKKKKPVATKGARKGGNRKSREKRRRQEGRYDAFAIMAEDSWGKDPDDTPRDRNVVLGGAMESNRSRH